MNCCSDFLSFFGALFLLLPLVALGAEVDCVCGGALGVLVSTATADVGTAMAKPNSPDANRAERRNVALMMVLRSAGAVSCRCPPRWQRLSDPPGRTTWARRHSRRSFQLAVNRLPVGA